MTYRLPSLRGLRSFEATARHLSFKRAATELHVTPGAVSQQVKLLEETMGVELFRRLSSGLLLTAEGESYLPPISEAFRSISRATDQVSAILKARVFKLGIDPGLPEELQEAVMKMRDRKSNAALISPVATNDLALVMDGELDGLLRSKVASSPDLHLDRIVFRAKDGHLTEATLVLPPGIAGCREHDLLLAGLSCAQVR